MKVLLFGANGQLGQEIKQAFAIKNHEVICYNAEKFDFLSLKKLEINFDFDIMVNAMAMTNTSLCEDEPEKAYLLNTIRVGELAKICHLKGAIFYHFSTDYVFSGNKGECYVEDDNPSPVNRYGCSKLAGEFEAMSFNEKTFVFRISSLFGVYGNNILKSLWKKSNESKELQVVSDQYISPTHAFDVAKMLVHFAEEKLTNYGIYHASCRNGCTWHELVVAFFEAMGKECSINETSWRTFPSNFSRPINSQLSTDKISKYFQMPLWEESVKNFAFKFKEFM